MCGGYNDDIKVENLRTCYHFVVNFVPSINEKLTELKSGLQYQLQSIYMNLLCVEFI